MIHDPDLYAPPAVYGVCSKCHTQKPRSEFQTGGGVSGACRSCRREARVKRPTIEQLEQIRRMSAVIYGEKGLAFKHHGMPATREEASELLKKLHDSRIYDREHGPEPEEQPRVQEQTMAKENRVCTKCGLSRSITQFRKAGRGWSKVCRGCEEGLVAVKRRFDPPPEPDLELPEPSASDKTIVVELPESEEGWVHDDLRTALTDPRLSTLRKLAEILAPDQDTEMTLDEAARVAAGLAALEVV